jgi:hypothetical protein
MGSRYPPLPLLAAAAFDDGGAPAFDLGRVDAGVADRSCSSASASPTLSFEPRS